MAKIQKRGRLIVAARSDLPLFGYLDPKTNQFQGFDVDLAREISRAIFGEPDRVEFKAATARTRIPMVKEEVADLALATITITPERAKEVDFSAVYFVTGPAVATLKENAPKYRRLEDLAGKTFAVTKGSVYEKVMKEKVPAIRIALIDTHAEILQAIQTRRVEGIVSDEVNILSMMRHDPNLVVAIPAFEPLSKYGAAIKKGRTDLLEFVNGVIRDVKASGRWKEIYIANIGGTVPEPPPAE
jgi:ABC-type amino acid transport substrate-binding protein